MREETRSDRREKIEAAAYALLAEHGYAGTSMLAIARRVRASNETLYRWYGDKQGLFRALVERNADEVRALLEKDLAVARPPLETLRALGPVLLRLLVGDRAITLNRAAAADISGELGATLTAAGRHTILPMIRDVFTAAQEAGHFAKGDVQEVADTYLSLLVGDLQIRRAIGSLDAPGPDEIARRADRAFAALGKIF